MRKGPRRVARSGDPFARSLAVADILESQSPVDLIINGQKIRQKIKQNIKQGIRDLEQFSRAQLIQILAAACTLRTDRPTSIHSFQ